MMALERQAITNNDMRPREVVAKPIRCWHCGNTLGRVTSTDDVIVRHKGRAVVARLPVAIVCEDCGERTELRART